VKTTGRLRAFASRPYDFSLVESPPGRVMREIDAALEFWRLPPPPGPILELGCGTGRLTKPLLQRGYVVNAVEPDSRTSIALTALQRSFPGQLRYAPDLGALASAGDHAAVVGVDVLHHTRPLELLALARPCVRGAGVFAFDEPDGAHPGWWVFVTLTGRLPNELGLAHTTRRRLERSFQEAGLSSLRMMQWTPGWRGRLSPRWFCSAICIA
jgi:SAM-dependent methyltransferase